MGSWRWGWMILASRSSSRDFTDLITLLRLGLNALSPGFTDHAAFIVLGFHCLFIQEGTLLIAHWAALRLRSRRWMILLSRSSSAASWFRLNVRFSGFTAPAFLVLLVFVASSRGIVRYRWRNWPCLSGVMPASGMNRTWRWRSTCVSVVYIRGT